MLIFSIFSKYDKSINQVTGGIIEVCIDISLTNDDNNMHMHRWNKSCDKSPHTQTYIFFLLLLSFQRAYVICRWFLKKKFRTWHKISVNATFRHHLVYFQSKTLCSLLSLDARRSTILTILFWHCLII